MRIIITHSDGREVARGEELFEGMEDMVECANRMTVKREGGLTESFGASGSAAVSLSGLRSVMAVEDAVENPLPPSGAGMV
jgi:hypothetical protein